MHLLQRVAGLHRKEERGINPDFSTVECHSVLPEDKTEAPDCMRLGSNPPTSEAMYLECGITVIMRMLLANWCRHRALVTNEARRAYPKRQTVETEIVIS